MSADNLVGYSTSVSPYGSRGADAAGAGLVSSLSGALRSPGLLGSLLRAATVAAITVNFILLAITVAGFFLADVAADWTQVYVQVGPRLDAGTLYDWPNSSGAFRYSPLAAYFFAAIAPIGVAGWIALHFTALVALPPRLAVMTLLFWPFWADVYNGNVMTFVFVAAVLALQGRRTGQVAFLSLALLVPRPLMLPVLAWLLWRVPWTRVPFIALAIANALVVWWSGYGPAWVSTLLSRGGQDIGTRLDLGPAHLIGLLWIPTGLLLAVILTWKGKLGLASIAANPYWLPYYLLMVLLELVPRSDTAVLLASRGSPFHEP